MTNKEAIAILEELPDRIVSILMPLDIDFDYKEALNLAIKSLEENQQVEWVRLSSRLYKCTNCGFITDVKYPFCHCGADMRKGNEEE